MSGSYSARPRAVPTRAGLERVAAGLGLREVARTLALEAPQEVHVPGGGAEGFGGIERGAIGRGAIEGLGGRRLGGGDWEGGDWEGGD